MIFPQVSSEFERMCACGRSVCTTTLGLRGSDTSTAVKFFGALSCASQRIRRPSRAIWIDMPSPIPPKPFSVWWASSLKLLQTGSYVPFADAPMAFSLVTHPRPIHELRPQRLAPVGDGRDLLFLEQYVGLRL